MFKNESPDMEDVVNGGSDVEIPRRMKIDGLTQVCNKYAKGTDNTSPTPVAPNGFVDNIEDWISAYTGGIPTRPAEYEEKKDNVWLRK